MKSAVIKSGSRICILCLIIVLDLLLFSCKKKKDTEEPAPLTPLLPTEKRIDISTLRAKFAMSPTSNYKFQADSMLYCTVIADEVNDNFFRELFVRDAGAAIRVKLKVSSSFVIGDSLKINIKNAYLNHEYNHIQLDSVDASTMITKIAGGLNPQPELVTIEQLISNTTAINPFQSRLVRINNAEFTSLSFPTFADPVLFVAKNHTIQACSPNKLIVRTSGYATFANSTPPTGNGSIIGIVSQYNNEVQLKIRDLSDMNMTGSLCNIIYHSKNFNDNSINSGGWTQQFVAGNYPWTTFTFNGATFALCTSYSLGVNNPCETWLISPSINLTNATNPNLYFQNSCNYVGPMMEAWVSTNYNSGLPQTATWVQLSPTLSGGSWVWVNSGALSLSSYKSANTRIAFKYLGTNAGAKSWEVEDIVVKEN